MNITGESISYRQRFVGETKEQDGFGKILLSLGIESDRFKSF